MGDQEGKYNIKAAALMLGIQPGTLRAWERRYQMIAPVRNEAGHRLYTEEHIKILKWLIKKVNQGFTISQAISLMGHNQIHIDSEALNLNLGNPLISLSDGLYDALIHFEQEKINEVINSMFSIFTMEKVIIDIFSQIFNKIEESFNGGKITKAQRNYSASFLQARISTIINSFPYNAHLTKAVCLTFSQIGDDVIGIGQLMFSFYLRKRGVEVINIGAFHSEEDIWETLEIIHPDLFIVSCENQKDLDGTLSLVELLSKNHQDFSVGICGEAITSMKPSDKEQFSTFLLGQTVNEWEMWLMERMVF
ncbi:MerR family transcriptional regulator [Bacillus sp. EB106-08-02-XG196]|uniref:MerR family transcriptional regulator n=1 Tax=Bacillus sp. EB106-08-02-XG196 TaxID=2737049 RepID=UPI0015C41C3D|nr:MerR family transcriptional regulator [Bacillus sp. EB106-08-02-XG196]NWQ39835.1 MerR family transcriptional regulator [Bacillus sp. EB106-08-02-XG196]